MQVSSLVERLNYLLRLYNSRLCGRIRSCTVYKAANAEVFMSQLHKTWKSSELQVQSRTVAAKNKITLNFRAQTGFKPAVDLAKTTVLIPQVHIHPFSSRKILLTRPFTTTTTTNNTTTNTDITTNATTANTLNANDSAAVAAVPMHTLLNYYYYYYYIIIIFVTIMYEYNNLKFNMFYTRALNCNV